MLDAPVSGGQKGAEDGTLTIMVGGNEQAFAHCSALFDAIGKNVRYVGPNGSGLKAKMANQVMVGITLLATVEGIRILQRSGVNVDEALNLIGSGAAKSALLEKYAPKILAQDYAPGFRIKLMSKDLRLASELAVDLGMDLPGLDLVQEMFAGAEKEGLGDLGTQGLYKLFDN